MKNLIVALGLTMVMILSVIIIAALNTNTAQQNKLDNAVELAAYQTLNEFFGKDTGSEEPERTKENIADRFEINLKKLLNTGEGEATYKIEIYGIDADEGMLSVKVIETYKNLSFDRTIDSKTTVIYEKKS